MTRPAVALLSKKNLLHNVGVIKKLLSPNTKLVAMVKADAYGHRIDFVAKVLDGFVDMLGVASIDEALRIRNIGVKSPILLAEGIFEKEELHIASLENFDVVFHSEYQVSWLEEIELTSPLNCWIKIDTGMGRLGFCIDSADDAYNRLLASSNNSNTITIMSHFACSDDKLHNLNSKQIASFKKFIYNKKAKLSLCNSAAIINFPEIHYDYVRPGLTIYGISPINSIEASKLDLKPVMTVQSKIISIKSLKKGESVGYGCRYICPEDKLIAVIGFGYGDGYPITAQDGAPVLVNGIRCPIVGRVSMDMIMVDITSCESVTIGDNVTLWGEGLPIEEVVRYTSNITWDMVTGLQHRVKFIWKE